MAELTFKEARIQAELFQLARSRINKEIGSLLSQFCKKNEHYFLKLWSRPTDGQLYKVVGYVCVLCRVQKPLEQKGSRCPVCNELWDEDYSSNEDVTACTHCGFNTLSNPGGLPLMRIPRGDEIYFPFAEF